jgi:polyisoprenyl-phosphate glycosyltransferase
MKNRLISVVTPCFNEEENVEDVYKQVKIVFQKMYNYTYEHIFIDNLSQDRTVDILKSICKNDKNVKLIVNARNYGHIRSPHYGLLQANGDAIILVFADLQDPPELIKSFLAKWEEGYKIVIGVKSRSRENPVMFLLRKIYYHIIELIAETDHVANFTGFGLYDRKFIDVLRTLDDPNPYFRGMVAELGFNRTEVDYIQLARKKGKTKNNFYTLYDLAMLGFVNHTKIPLRLASFIGFGVATVSLCVAILYFIYKLVYWDKFILGTAPLVIGLFFFSSVQLFFIGIIGEYIGAIFTHVRKRPLVVEKERVNFK